MTDALKMEPSAEERVKAVKSPYYIFSVAFADAVQLSEESFRDGAKAQRERIRQLLREPSDEFVETFSRKHHQGAWKRVDDNIIDDDWNGGAALNMRSAMLRDAKIALVAIAAALDVGNPT
jgi:hypothetical protein